MEVGHSQSLFDSNDIAQVFIGVYGPTLGGEREDFQAELGDVKGLWVDLGALVGVLLWLDSQVKEEATIL